MSTGAGWEVPRRHDRIEPAARHAGYRGMDDMHPPRAAISRVNALGGTPPYENVPRYPSGYMPKGRVPVSTP